MGSTPVSRTSPDPPQPASRADAVDGVERNVYLSAIRAGMVSVVPLTIIGGLFMIVAYLPVSGFGRPGWFRYPDLQQPVAGPGHGHVWVAGDLRLLRDRI